jgi:hypothetical protein
MKDCVIFAAWVPYIDRFQIYIDTIKQNYSDCDVFVGINPNSHPDTENLLKANGINNIIHVKPELSVNSDASAFQAALSLYKNSNKNYRYIYFIHTKGMSYNSSQQWKVSRESYFDSFITKRATCEKILEPDDVGGCGLVANFCWTMYNSNYIKSVTKFIDSPYKNVQNILWLTTHYAMKNECVKYFVDNCKLEFFTTNLQDRYYFESSFPLIVELTSKKKRECCIYWDDNIPQNYDIMIKDWNSRKDL